MALDVERIIPDFIRRRFHILKKTIRPNKMKSNPLSRLIHAGSIMSSQAIQKALNPELVSWLFVLIEVHVKLAVNVEINLDEPVLKNTGYKGTMSLVWNYYF